MANIGFGTQFIERLKRGDIRKIFYIITFDLEVASGEVVNVDDRTPSDGVFQIEFMNIISNEPIKIQVRDTFTNRNWFSDHVYSHIVAGDGKSYGYLPSPILVNPSTQLVVTATYNKDDPLATGSDKASGQLVIGGYILVGLREVSEIYK